MSTGRLLLPEGLAARLPQAGLRTAADVMSYLGAFPGAAAGTLGWWVDEVRGAAAGLRDVLRPCPGTLPDLVPPPGPEPSLGALDASEVP